MAKAKFPIQSEYDAQMAVFKWADTMSRKWPELRLLVGSLNGAVLVKRQAMIVKYVGLKNGFPDIQLPIPRGGYHGLFIELKRDKKSKMTLDQDEWQFILNDQGYKAVRCNGKEEAIKTIIEYLEG